MIKRFLLILLAFIPLFMSAQNRKKDMPDFAFPQQVIKDADAMLDKALADGDGVAVVDALIRSGLARTAISFDSIPSVICRIEAVAASEKNEVTHALLDMLLAEVYSSYYQSDSYRLDQRQSLANPGNDITLWSGREFKNRIVELYDHALSHSDALKNAPIANYSAIINCDKTTALFYPTLFDFASLRAIDGLSESSAVALRILSPVFYYEFNRRLPNFLSKPSQKAIEIADNWVAANVGAPRIAALLSRYKMLENYIIDSGEDEQKTTDSDPLLRLYEDNKQTPYAIELLLSESGRWLSPVQKKAYFNAYKNFEATYPDYFRISAVTNELMRLSQPSAELRFPAQVARGKDFKIKVQLSNLKSTELLIYRVKDSKVRLFDDEYSLKDCNSAPVARIPVDVTDEIPFAQTKEVTYRFDDYGVYVVATSFSKIKNTDDLSSIKCSDIALMSTRGSNYMRIFAVNGTDGSPVANVSVSSYNRDNALLRTHTSDSDGKVEINRGDLRSITFNAVKGADRYGSTIQQYVADNGNDRMLTTAFIRPALAIYHPGDTLDFVAVAYNYIGNTRSLVKNADLKAVLRNPNYTAVDTISIRTDNFGRASGRFAIPEDGLTGNFTINILDDTLKYYYASTSVMVSDYKLPTYEASVDSVIINDADGSVTILGKAMTYSGFPVQNASVEASLSGMQGYWWRNNIVKFHTDSMVTDEEGCFKWVIAKDVLDASPFLHGRYQASFVVTSQSGENRSCQDTFSMMKKSVIVINDGKWIAASENSDVNILVTNPLGTPIDASLNLSFKAADGNIVKVAASSRNGVTNADLTKLSSGTYELTVEAVGFDADEVKSNVLVYNASDGKCPVAEGIWAPSLSIKANAADRKAEFLFGSPCNRAAVLMSVFAGDSIIEQKWIGAKAGMNRLPIAVPENIDGMEVQLSAIDNFEIDELSFTVSIENPDAGLQIKVERLRSQLTPLSPESVTVKVVNAAGSGVPAAVIFDMYSKALDNLAMQSWEFIPSSGYMSRVYFDNNLGRTGFNEFSVPVTFLTTVDLDAPIFNFYGMNWNGRYGNRLGMKLYGSSNRRASAGILISNDAVLEESVVTVEDMALSKVESDAGNDASAGGDAPTQQYRPAEVPLAFFAPMLSSDENGNLTYSFTVPNANTTWAFNALAYTNNLATAHTVRDIISSKPIMVEPNFPRFIRTGDVVDIRALVMNATDSVASATTVFEIVDPVSGDVISMQSVSSEVAPKQSETVKFNVVAPNAPGTIMVRVKSSVENYSDGVVNIIPVLESSQPVIDASTFYLTPDQKELVRDIPTTDSDSKVTVSFCENPTWEVVSALPGLRSNDDATTSLAASAQVFSAAVSRYVLQLNPQVEPALKQWLASGKEGDMLSMLNSNDDLKQLVLAATPWMQEAQSDEERISRLALIFDSKEIDRSIKSAVKKLEKMQRSSGGWSWTDNYDEPSLWATMIILNNFAELRQLGCCPAELDGMTKKALKYIDSEVAKTYAKYPATDYSHYTYVRSLYLDIPLSTDAQKAYNASVQRILKNWKKSSTVSKAADALVLYRNDYKNVARQILDSLREYATSTPQLGMWWDSVDGSSWRSLTAVGQTAFILEAFNTIDPGCPEIDKIRQWLILNKIVQDWGSSVDASACVASILKCGSSWLNRPGDVKVMLNGKLIEPGRVDKLTGKFVAEMADSMGELRITRTAQGPAWGAVIEQSTKVMKNIKAHSIPELSLSKELYVRTDRGWTPTDTFSVGQVVKVRLLIKSMRDMDYITVVDNRAATFEPVVQTPRPVYCDGLVFYLENRDAVTNLFIDRMPKGQYIIEYEMNVNNAGSFSSGIATIQSQYAPEMTAHSAGSELIVSD